MRVKTGDPDTTVSDLTALLKRADLSDETRSWIQHELWTAKCGRRGEHDAEYEIEFHFGQRPDVATLHGLRIECAGRVAQIDHLIVTRYLDIWVCESKSSTGRIEINEYGEWEAFYKNRSIGMKNPVLQTWAHKIVLADLFARRLVVVPTIGGRVVTPKYRAAVLFSDRSRIHRPVAAQEHVERELRAVMKVERLFATVEQTLRERPATDTGQQISCEDLAAFATKLAALHRPHAIDWLAKFGLSPQPVAVADDTRGTTSNVVAIRLENCDSCGIRLRPGEIEYCRDKAALFANRLLCYRCQTAARATVP